MDVGTPELILIIVIIILLFGPGRISKLSGEIGSSIRAFREGLASEKEKGKKESEKNDTETPVEEK